MNIGFIIPVFGKPEQVKKCIESIGNLKTDYNVSIHEHDNNKDNIGFTAAINEGLLGYSDNVDYAVVLNQDCYVKPDFIEEAVDFMEKHPECFIAGAKQLSSDDEDLIIHGGCTTAFPEGRHIVGRVSLKSCEKDRQMPWVNGACMIVNMSLLPIVGLMDPNFFLIGSDSDWCYTARQRGLEVWYMSKAVVVHEQGISSKKGSKDLEYKKLIDMTYFRDKWIMDGAFTELSQEIFS